VSRQIEDKMESVKEIDEDDLGFPKDGGGVVAAGAPSKPQATPIRCGRPPKPPPQQSTDQLLNMVFKMVQDQD